MIRSVVIGALASGTAWLVYGAGFAGAIVLLAIRAVHGQTSYGNVVMVAALIQRTQQQMSQVSSALSQIATNSRAAQYLFWLQDHHRTFRWVAAAPRPVPQVLDSGIRLAGVTFTYPGTDRTVLKDVSLLLPAGWSVALVGENGAGQATGSVELLTRHYRPTAGSVQLNSVFPRRGRHGGWRRRTTAATRTRPVRAVHRRLSASATCRTSGTSGLSAPLFDRAHGADALDGLPDGLGTPCRRSQANGQDLLAASGRRLHSDGR